MKYSFFVAGPLPGQNEIIKAAKGCGGRGTMYSEQKRKWTRLIVDVIKRRKLPSMGMIRVKFLWTEKKRNRDPDNISAGQKFIFDALKESGVIENDGWKNVDEFHHMFQTGNIPGVEVFIEEVPMEVAR